MCPRANVLIPSEHYEDALNCFKEKHLLFFSKIIKERETNRAKSVRHMENEMITSNDNYCADNDGVDDNDPMLFLDQELDIPLTENDSQRNEEEKANEVINRWIRETQTIDWKPYMTSNKSPFVLQSAFGKICNTDILAWYRDVGVCKYESVALMAWLQHRTTLQ
jgi:hypothetical protein